MGADLTDGMFKLFYLKAGVSNLHFDSYVWVDADTAFIRNPDQVLATLRRAPIHVPLGIPLAEIPTENSLRGMSPEKYQEIMWKAGVYNEVYSNRAAFWIVKRSAVDVICELAQRYYAFAKAAGERPHGDGALGFAMQMLCGDPQAHRAILRPDLWWSDETGEIEPPNPLVECSDQRKAGVPRKRSEPSALIHFPGYRRRVVTATREREK